MQEITFGDLNASHTGLTVRIDDGRQVIIGLIESIGHHLDIGEGGTVGVTSLRIKGKKVGVQRLHAWPVMVLDRKDADEQAAAVTE